jgi:hypothetical protein
MQKDPERLNEASRVHLGSHDQDTMSKINSDRVDILASIETTERTAYRCNEGEILDLDYTPPTFVTPWPGMRSCRSLSLNHDIEAYFCSSPT